MSRRAAAVTTTILLFSTTALAGNSVVMSGTVSAGGKVIYGGTGAGSATDPSARRKLMRLSTGVGVALLSTSAGYSAATQHDRGDRAYGVSHENSDIYTKKTTPGTPAITTLETIGTTDFVNAGWLRY